jgi:circadian clock protein KaiC
MALRFADHLRTHAVTGLYISMQATEGVSGLDLSSVMDTWIVLANTRSDVDLSRRLHIVKARGTAHSSQVRRMEITDTGVRLADLAPRAAETSRS